MENTISTLKKQQEYYFGARNGSGCRQNLFDSKKNTLSFNPSIQSNLLLGEKTCEKSQKSLKNNE